MCQQLNRLITDRQSYGVFCNTYDLGPRTGAYLAMQSRSSPRASAAQARNPRRGSRSGQFGGHRLVQTAQRVVEPRGRTGSFTWIILPIVHSSRRPSRPLHGRGDVATVARVLVSMLAISRRAIAAGMTAFMIRLTWPGMMTDRQTRTCWQAHYQASPPLGAHALRNRPLHH
jgi:hypothetical protein